MCFFMRHLHAAENMMLKVVATKFWQKSHHSRSSFAFMCGLSSFNQNMVGPGEVDDELEGETSGECERFGPVRRCLIYEIKVRGRPLHHECADTCCIFVCQCQWVTQGSHEYKPMGDSTRSEPPRLCELVCPVMKTTQSHATPTTQHATHAEGDRFPFAEEVYTLCGGPSLPL